MIERQRGRANAQRRVTHLPQIINLATKLAQGVHQVTNRALVHARYAAQFIVTANDGQCCGERANGRAGIAHEQLGLTLRDLPAQAINFHRGAALAHTATQLLERCQHDAGVV